MKKFNKDEQKQFITMVRYDIVHEPLLINSVFIKQRIHIAKCHNINFNQTI